MDPQTARTVVEQAHQQAQINNEIFLWLFVSLFMIAPVIVLFVWIFVLLIVMKCPRCGNRRNNMPAVQTIKDGTKVVTKRIFICAKCDNEFPRR